MAHTCADDTDPLSEPVVFRASPTAKRMARLVTRDEPDGVWRCRYCRRRVTQLDHPWEWDIFPFPEIDHVHPRKWGGTNGVVNLVLACDTCNKRKGARLLSELPANWWGVGR